LFVPWQIKSLWTPTPTPVPFACGASHALVWLAANQIADLAAQLVKAKQMPTFHCYVCQDEVAFYMMCRLRVRHQICICDLRTLIYSVCFMHLAAAHLQCSRSRTLGTARLMSFPRAVTCSTNHCRSVCALCVSTVSLQCMVCSAANPREA